VCRGLLSSGYGVWVTTEADPAAALPWWRRMVAGTWFPLVASLVVTGLILSFVAKPYLVPSGSMEMTLQPGDRILVNRLAYTAADPGNGDVIVFDAGVDWDAADPTESNPLKAALRWVGEVTGFGPSGPLTLVKRAIGTPGQTVACCSSEGAVTVDGEPLDETYIFNDFPFEPGVTDCTSVPASLRCFDAVTVPKDSYLMLGDNRAGSADSAVMCRAPGAPDRCWRWATREGIVGRAVAILWPITRWAPL